MGKECKIWCLLVVFSFSTCSCYFGGGCEVGLIREGIDLEGIIKLGSTATTVWRQRNETVNAKELTPKRSHTEKGGKNLFSNNNNSLSHPRHSTSTI